MLLLVPFLRDGFRARHAARHWLRHGDARALAQVKAALGLSAVPPSGPLDAGLADLHGRAAAAVADFAATIIMPVFDAFDLLPQALGRVVAYSDGDWQLIVVDDCSADRRVRPWLRGWRAGLPRDVRARVTLVENDVNLGFVGAVNRALALVVPGGRHVLLLNSDALVPAGWLGRLLAPILEDARVASVTPMSNDGEIFGAPAICAPLPLRRGEGEAIDRLAACMPQSLTLAEAPTGVGFCMAMSAAFLRRVPSLDTAFAPGYGEEVDWCQRTAALGGRHLGTAALFVEHQGAASFGGAARDGLRQAGGVLLRRRYPRFDGQVAAFIRDDPLRSARIALALAWAGARMGQVPVILAHGMGGGAELVLQRRIAADVARGGACVVLRVGGALRWRIEVHSAAGVTSGETDDIALMRQLIGLLPGRRVIYSCGAGDSDPLELPRILLALATAPGDRVEVLLHDYLPVSPSWTLLDSDGVYRGVPGPMTRDPAHRAWRRLAEWQEPAPDASSGAGPKRRIPSSGHARKGLPAQDYPMRGPVPLDHWQAEWGVLLARADRITAFSEASREIVVTVWPQLADRITVTPHNMPALVAVRPLAGARGHRGHRGSGPVIGILGNIGRPKGAAVVQALARRLASRAGARLVVIGMIDPAFRLMRPARVHGSYAPADIPALARRHGVDRWFIPSIWPETFSLTTHEALATGLPVWCFDLGAQAEAVRRVHARTGRGGVIPLPRGEPDADAILAALLSGPAPAIGALPAVDPGVSMA